MRRNPKSENLAKLTPEQMQVYLAWQAEGEKADVIMQQILDALATNDQEAVHRLTLELDALIPVTCEHGHSVYLSCMACADIERTLFPEAFDADGNRIDLDDLYPVPKSDKTSN